MGFLPPVVVTLLADGKQFSAEVSKAEAQMARFGATADTAGARFGKFANKASTAVIGIGVVLAGYAVDKAVKFQEALDAIQNQSGASAVEMANLRTEILRLSSATATSTANIGSAFLQAEKSGLRGARAYQLVSNAAKAAVVTGVDVTQMTQTLIAAQELQVNRGMSVAQTTDLIVEANRRHIGSVNTLVAVLSGKLGGALAATGISFAQIAAIADVSSKAGYTQARSMVMLATSLAKVENPTSSTTKSLLKMNINAAALAREAKRPGGIIQVLEDLRQQSVRAHIPLASLFTGVFGASSLGLITVLNRNLGELKNTTAVLGSASGDKLNSAFGLAQSQIAYKMKELRTQFDNAMTGAGLLLLPTVTNIANWAEKAVKYFQTHPLAQKIASDAAIATFAAAVAFKIGKGLVSVFNGVKSLFTGTAISANTAATIANTDALLGRTGASVVTGGGSTLGTFGKTVSVFAAGAAAFYGTTKLLQSSAMHDFGAGTTGNMTVFYNARNQGIINKNKPKPSGGHLTIKPVLRVSRG